MIARMSAVRPRIAYGPGAKCAGGPCAGIARNPLSRAGVSSFMKWIGTAALAEA